MPGGRGLDSTLLRIEAPRQTVGGRGPRAQTPTLSSVTVRELPDWWSRHHMAGDAVVALAVMPIVLISATDSLNPALMGAPGLVISVLVLAPMLWRRRYPDVLTACAVAAHLLMVVLSDRISPISVVVPIVLYAEAAYSRWRWYRAWTVVAVLGAAIAALRWSSIETSVPLRLVTITFIFLFCLAVVAASWVAGELTRQRRRNVEALRDRAEALERERDQRTRLAAEEERSRIAREMHDVVAHNLSVIVVQADGARYAATHGSDPTARAEIAARALETIAETAREALAETRRLVGVLRSEDESAEYAPRATLAAIGELVARMAEAGVAATYAMVGDPADHPPLTAGAEMAAYRVVQESLTNVVRHGGPGATVHVSLAHGPDGLVVTVRDAGRGSDGGTGSDGQGHGLIGMRERVAAYGGTLLARDRLAGGFEVIATLPAGGNDAPTPHDVRRGGLGESRTSGGAG